MKFHKRLIGIALLSVGCAVLASGGGGGGNSGGGDGGGSGGGNSGGGGGHGRTPVIDPVIQTAQAAIDQKDWETAQAILLKALTDNAQNADYHNLYAYS
ncbi:MAG TPA: hypothetical protein VIM63_12460, partial [Rhodoferax sp.]